MAHIHLEDGSFTLYWVVVWWIIALCLIGVALFFLRSKYKPDPKKITIAAFVTAAAFAVFQVQIPVAGGVHPNLTPLVGILTGPIIGTLIVFVVNILSAAIGHGGWGLVGGNILVNFTEVIVAWFAFMAMKKITADLFSQAGVATFAGLFAGNLVMIAVIFVSGIQGVNQTNTQILTGLSLIAAINMGVAIIEAFLTGLIVAYIGKMRPDLLGVVKK